jgi:hypothetical protein
LVVSTAQLSCGSVPTLTAAQMPDFCVVSEAEQAVHLSVHALLQQTPSAQNPDEHSLGLSQAAPSIFSAAHRVVVRLQYEVLGQSLSTVQGVRHPSTASQETAAQLMVPTGLQAPLPSQVEVGVKLAPLQKAIEQT